MTAVKIIDVERLRRMPLPEHEGEVDKNSRGKVLIVGSSVRVPGALILCGEAALRAGAGKIQLAGPQSILLPIGVRVPESGLCPLKETGEGELLVENEPALYAAARESHAVLIGPGMMDPELATHATCCLVANTSGPHFVLDALALSGLWSQAETLRRHEGRIVLTPHLGEMAALCDCSKDDVEADPIRCSVRAAEHFNAVVVLKGSTTYVTSPQGVVLRYDDGPVGLATAGSGDVLAGVLAGLLARGAAALTAAAWAVFLHGDAGRRLSVAKGRVGFLARELSNEIPQLMHCVPE